MSNIYDITMNKIDKFIEENQPIRNTDEETSVYFMYLAFNDYFRNFRETIYNPFFIEEMKKAIKYGKDKNCLRYSYSHPCSVNTDDNEFRVFPVFFSDGCNIENDYRKYAIVFRFDKDAEYQLAFFQDQGDEGHYRYNPSYSYKGIFDENLKIRCDIKNYGTHNFNNYFYSNIKDNINNVFQIMSKYDKYSELINGIPVMKRKTYYSKNRFNMDIFEGDIYFNLDGSCNTFLYVNNVFRDFIDAVWNDDRMPISEKLEMNKDEILKRIPLKTKEFGSIIKMLYDENKGWGPSEDVIKQYTLKK